MYKGMFLGLVLGVTLGCSNSDKDSSDSISYKISNNEGYVAYRIDDNPWIEVTSPINLPLLTPGQTFSYVSFCDDEEGPSGVSLKLDYFSQAKLVNEDIEFNLGCSDKSNLEEVTLASANSGIAIYDAELTNANSYTQSGTGDNSTIKIEMLEKTDRTHLAVMGESENSDYYFYLDPDFTFENGETHSIDFLGDLSTPAFLTEDKSNDSYKYSLQLIEENQGFKLFLPSVNDRRISINPSLLPGNFGYSEKWTAREKSNGFNLSYTSYNKDLSSESNLLPLNLSELSLSIDGQNSINIDQNGSTDSILNLPFRGILASYSYSDDFSFIFVEYSENANLKKVFSLEELNLPNFPNEFSIENRTLDSVYVRIEKGEPSTLNQIGSYFYTMSKEITLTD